MRELIARAGFATRVRDRATAAVDALESGESMAHEGRSEFHEVGGVDALVDITGTMLALEALDVERCYCPVVTVGAGTITRSAHGAIPAAPGPAAANILEAAHFPLRFIEASHELVTPTGAAILSAVAEPGGTILTPQAHGAGAGSHDSPGRPNALRVFIGAGEAGSGPSETRPTRSISLLEANIDDLQPTLVAHAQARLIAEGALDAWTEQIGMKKGRAAVKLCALVERGTEPRFADLFLAETTTLGVRVAAYERYELGREVRDVDTSLGTVRVKFAERNGRHVGVPEDDDVKRLAASLGRPAIEVYQQIIAELHDRQT